MISSKTIALACVRIFTAKIGMVIDTTVFYQFVPLRMTLTFIQGHSGARNQKLVLSFSHKFLNPIVFNEI